MIVHKCSAVDFRNIASAEVELCDGVNVLVGDNGQGKTNIIEAIYLCSVGRSFRGADENEMIRFGKSASSVSVDFSDMIRKQNVSMHIFRDKRRQVEKNKVKITRMSDVVGCLAAVMFCPEHLGIVKEGPAARRNYLDIAISQLRPLYISSLQRYSKILKQRNKLIRDAEEDRRTFNSTVDFWSEQLAEEAAAIACMRVEYIIKARGMVSELFSDMTSGKEIASVRYAPSSKQEEQSYLDREFTKNKYLSLLSENHDREIGAGTTLWGIHKDDISIDLNDHPARAFASQGQQRSIALAMKLSEGEICRESRGEYPVFLLDDVLSELDSSRRDYLINRIKGRQVIMTTCETTPHTSSKIIRVNNGEYL